MIGPEDDKDDSEDDHGVLPSFDVVEGEGNSGLKPGRSRCHVLSIGLADQCLKMSFTVVLPVGVDLDLVEGS